MARRLFCCWLRSTEQVTVMPVGLWVMRTAEATLLTFWPPGPLARTKATKSSSSSGISTSVSGIVKIRDDINRSEAGLAFALCVEGAGADQAMHAGLGAHIAEGVGAFDEQSDIFDAGLLAEGDRLPKRPSRGDRKNRDTSAGASRPSPGLRCRRRRLGLDEAAIRDRSCRREGIEARPSRPAFPIGEGAVGLFDRLGIAGFFAQLVRARTSSMSGASLRPDRSLP